MKFMCIKKLLIGLVQFTHAMVMFPIELNTKQLVPEAKKIVLIKRDLEKGFTASVSKYHYCHHPWRNKNKVFGRE